MTATATATATASFRPPRPLRPVRVPAPTGRRPPAQRRVSEATYRRRRAVVGTVLAAVVAVGAVVGHDVLVGSSGGPASAATGRPAAVVRTRVVARPGDSLWSIALAHRGEVPVNRYVEKLIDLNGGASIVAGQSVVLP